ncbi:ribonuclease H-like domain-containing protein [Tanacetum coccineum]
MLMRHLVRLSNGYNSGVLSLAISRHWPVHQLDVKNAFLHADLSETVYMSQPLGFWDSTHPNMGTNTAYLLLYADDIVLTASFETFGMFLSQPKYVVQILERARMVNYNPNQTPVDTESKLRDDGDPKSDPTLYRSLADSLQYLTFTRPDISYAVQQVCLYMHDPRKPHFSALKRILRYVEGTLDHGLQLFSSSTTSLVAYQDADWDGCPTTRSVEAEYRGVANVVAETCWLRNLLRELHTPLSSATLVYCDNQGYRRGQEFAPIPAKGEAVDRDGEKKILRVWARMQLRIATCRGLRAYLDIRMALTQTGMTDFVPGRAMIDVAHCKRVRGRRDYMLKRIRKFSMAQDIGTRVDVHIFNRISFAIAKGVGAQIVFRLPSNLL